MAEMYTASLDAYVHGNIRSGKVKPKSGGAKVPWYLKDPNAPKPVGLKGADLWAAVDAMQSRLGSGRKH